MLTGISFLFFLLTAYYLFFLYRVLNGLRKIESQSVPPEVSKEFITVIVPFRNEAGVILENLKSLENQKYDENLYEVLYVDDNSTDNSVNILEKNIHSENIKVLKFKNADGERAYKKKAIEYAIKQSRGEIIITTDADCTHGKEWLPVMVSCFDDETGFVSGPVEFLRGEKLFDKLQSLEFAGLIITGAGLIGAGNPAICNAANLGFRKNVFFEVGGYSGNLNLSSGDDEFLMQKIHANTKYKIKFCADKKAKAFTKPNEDFKSFYQQRKRWASKGLFYKNKRFVLSLVFIFMFYFSLLVSPFLALFYNPFFWMWFAVGILSKMLIEYAVLKKGITMLYDKDLLRYFFVAEIFHVPYIVFAPLLGLRGNYIWKEREIKR